MALFPSCMKKVKHTLHCWCRPFTNEYSFHTIPHTQYLPIVRSPSCYLKLGQGGPLIKYHWFILNGCYRWYNFTDCNKGFQLQWQIIDAKQSSTSSCWEGSPLTFTWTFSMNTTYLSMAIFSPLSIPHSFKSSRFRQ